MDSGFAVHGSGVRVQNIGLLCRTFSPGPATQLQIWLGLRAEGVGLRIWNLEFRLCA